MADSYPDVDKKDLSELEMLQMICELEAIYHHYDAQLDHLDFDSDKYSEVLSLADQACMDLENMKHRLQEEGHTPLPP